MSHRTLHGKSSNTTLDLASVSSLETITVDTVGIRGEAGPSGASSDLHSAEFKDPSGFVNKVDSSIVFDESLRSFTISPVNSQYRYFVGGPLFTAQSSQSITIPNVDGEHFIWFNATGTLETSQVYPGNVGVARIASIYWDSATNSAVFLNDDRHLANMSSHVEDYIDSAHGPIIVEGFDFSINTSLDNDDHYLVNGSPGVYLDATNEISSISSTLIPVYARMDMVIKWSNIPSLYNIAVAGTVPLINTENMVNGWELSAVAQEKFFNYYLVATQDVNNPIIAIPGTSTFDTYQESQQEILDRDSNVSEWYKVLYRLTYKRSAAFLNTLGTQIINISDFRRESDDVSIIPLVQEGDKHLSMSVTTPTTQVTISHNLQKMPAVDIIDSTGDKVVSVISYIQDGIILNFNNPFIGKIILN